MPEGHMVSRAGGGRMSSVIDARMLVADDNPDNRDVLTRRLRRLGYTRIESAEDGQQALDMNAAAPFDVILLDVMMPRKSGVEVLEALHGEGSLEATPVIMISASTELDIVVRCLELGAEDYLLKPFNPAVLRARLGSVLERRRLRAELRHHVARLDSELADARRQQLAMVPDIFPCPTGGRPVEVHAAMHPAREVGGDFYDCFEIDSSTLCIAVGDVVGKGMPAALFMARARSLLRSATLLQSRLLGLVPAPDEIAKVVNEELCKNNPQYNFVTLFVGLLDTATGTLRYLNAGHVRPYILPHAGVPFQLECPADVPLGFDPDFLFRVGELSLAKHDALVVVTDGVQDMTHRDGRMFGGSATLTCLSLMTDRRPASIVADLTAAIFAFGQGAEQADDVTILALYYG
jgi:sigma-B regulation protein RsbU (phosphoserine phosphatase)